MCIFFQDIEADLGKRDSNYEHGPITPVELEGDKITLEIPNEPVCGWKMDELNSLQVRFTLAYIVLCFTLPMICAQMYTDNIVRLSFGRALIPFQVSVCWVGGGERAQKRLTQKVVLHGTEQPSNFLTVTSPRQCTGT